MTDLVHPTSQPAGPVGLERLPQTKDELWWTVFFLFGVRIPRVAVCQNHCAPFDAFAEAYFAEAAVSVWKASRGFGGKSYLLALLTTTEAALLGAEASVLGGSAAQSLNVHEHTGKMWTSPNAPRQLLAASPTRYETLLNNGARIRALMASQRSVRGPHPQRLRLDEIDEMEMEILEAAQGQPMPDRGIETQTVMSSTHQYPDGTMTAILERARHMGWSVRTWCYRESMGTKADPGWLKPSTVMRKQMEVPPRFWNVEYELQAPSFEGRAIDTEAVDAMFVGRLYDDPEAREVIFGLPQAGVPYVTGVDWAKEKDWTIIWTFDASARPWRTVAWQRVRRLPWPDMVERVTKRMERFPGVLVHDATGLGNVVSDLLEVSRKTNKVYDMVLVGRKREECFNEYISAIEERELTSPRIDYAYHEHLYTRRDDLFKAGGHPPDTFVAGALAWSARNSLKRKSIGKVTTFLRGGGTSPWRVPHL